MLSKKDILARKAKLIKVDFDGDCIYIKEFTSKVREQFIKAETFAEQQLITILNCLCDEAGKPVFTEEDIEDIEALSADYLDELFLAISEATKQKDGKEVAGN